MEEDIEIAVSAKEAKNHLTSLEEELRNLHEQLLEFDVGESPTKRVSLNAFMQNSTFTFLSVQYLQRNVWCCVEYFLLGQNILLKPKT